MLCETVRELHCNLMKGLHEDNAYYVEKNAQLKRWAVTLAGDLRSTCSQGEKILEGVGVSLYLGRQRQAGVKTG